MLIIAVGLLLLMIAPGTGISGRGLFRNKEGFRRSFAKKLLKARERRVS
jgi:hypothetical protein